MDSTEISNIPISHCPRCNHELSAAMDSEGNSPLPGDFSVCFHCNEILVFDEGLFLSKPTTDDLLTADLTQLQAAQRAVNKIREDLGEKKGAAILSKMLDDREASKRSANEIKEE